VKILYLAPDLNDAAVVRRINMLTIGGAEVTTAAFRRGTSPADTMLGAGKVVDLGVSYRGSLWHRAVRLASISRSRVLDSITDGQSFDAVLARNLDMLWLASTVASRSKAPLVYECLDIHPLLSRTSLVSTLFRRVEARLLRNVRLVLTSSPGFVANYFGSLQPSTVPVEVIENKALWPDGCQRPAFGAAKKPWVIGLFGIIRGRRTLKTIDAIAEQCPNVMWHLRGIIDPSVEGHEKTLLERPNVTYFGPYRPSELSAHYRAVHFVWCFDTLDEHANSRWLLPNRLYEGSLFGTVPLADPATETGRWLNRRGVGVTLADPVVELPGLLRGLSLEDYRGLQDRLRALPVSDLVCTSEECRRLAAMLADAPANDLATAVSNREREPDRSPATTPAMSHDPRWS
jgi:succinoglycan biosynthesis protein ExoL